MLAIFNAIGYLLERRPREISKHNNEMKRVCASRSSLNRSFQNCLVYLPTVLNTCYFILSNFALYQFPGHETPFRSTIREMINCSKLFIPRTLYMYVQLNQNVQRQERAAYTRNRHTIKECRANIGPTAIRSGNVVSLLARSWPFFVLDG